MKLAFAFNMQTMTRQDFRSSEGVGRAIGIWGWGAITPLRVEAKPSIKARL